MGCCWNKTTTKSCCCSLSCCSTRCCAPSSPDEVRIKTGNIEKAEMLNKAEEYIKGRYKKIKTMQAIGSRLQKYWMEIEEKTEHKKDEKQTYVLSISKFSSVCPLGEREEVIEKITTLNKLLSVINEHPNILEIKEVGVERIEKIDADVVIVIQRKNPEGSLRDCICISEPFLTWSKKMVRSKSNEEFYDVAKKYAIQILQGMLFLKKIGFRYLGNIQLGNIFVTESPGGDSEQMCKICGHENALFGYRTNIYGLVQQHGYLENIDVIMFGHVLYGLAKGKVMQEGVLFPEDEDIERITDANLKDILKYIFKRSDTKMKHSLEDILNKMEEVKWYHWKPSRDLMKGVDKTHITEEMKELLQKVYA